MAEMAKVHSYEIQTKLLIKSKLTPRSKKSKCAKRVESPNQIDLLLIINIIFKKTAFVQLMIDQSGYFGIIYTTFRPSFSGLVRVISLAPISEISPLDFEILLDRCLYIA